MAERAEAAAYHCLNIACRSDYKELCRRKSGRASWRAAGDGLFSPPPEEEQELLSRLQKQDIKLILREDGGFPKNLLEIPLPPFALYVKGDCGALRKAPALALVGTRKATPDGKKFARDFARKLAGAGITIVSGLALGADAAAHEGALQAGGKTVAVLPCGLDEIYPRMHYDLAERILKSGGALVSEYPPGTTILPYRFLERNRIISGLSRGTLVIEAGLRSGSLATARFATEQNRDVFVVPGPINQPNYAGANLLIRAGAELITEPEQILANWNLGGKPESGATRPEDPPETLAIINYLLQSRVPAEVDKIAAETNLKTYVVNQALALLVLTERAEETPQGYRVLGL